MHEQRIYRAVDDALERAATLEETLEAMADLFLEKEDPIEKAKRAEVRRAAKPAPGQAKRDSNTRALPAAAKHAVHLKDGARCTYTDLRGNRCQEERWLEIHHVIPFGHHAMAHS